MNAKFVRILAATSLVLVVFSAPKLTYASEPSRPFFTLGNSKTVDLLKDYRELPSSSTIDDRIDIYPNGILQNTGVNLSIRGLFGFPLGASSLSDSSENYQATFPPCLSSTQSDCISKLYVITADGVTKFAQPLKELPPLAEEYGGRIPTSMRTFDENAEKRLPAGGNKWVWHFTDYDHRGGSLILPSVQLVGFKKTFADGSWIFDDPVVQIQVHPVSVEGPVCIYNAEGGCQYVDPSIQFGGALVSYSDYSIRRDILKSGEKIGIQFRSTVPWTRWSASTIGRLEFNFSKSGRDYVYEVSGEPGLIPEVLKNIPLTSENATTVKEISGPNFKCPTGDALISDCSAPIFLGGKGGVGADSTVYDQVERLEALTNGQATFARRYWIIQTNENSFSYQNLACVKQYKGLVPAGISSSNATLAQDSPPSWNSASQEFTYKVAAFKRLPDGQLFKGHYSLLIPTEIARCLWPSNLTSARLQLSVISSNGAEELATVTTGITNLWFSFQAAGFHFSSPKLVAKVISTPPAVTKTKTISCIKGKLVKKVTSTAPKCPSGYKKK